MPRQGLGNSAIASVADDEQLARFEGKWAAMAITEPEAGSDSAAIRTTAVLDGDEYVLNGEKIYVTAGERAELVVVWASLDRSKGRAAIKSFVVERSNPGMKLDRVEDKLGIRASDTAAFSLEDCRVPKENLLGSPEIDAKQGFAGAMQTFDNTRPLVAAMAVGADARLPGGDARALAEAGVEVDPRPPAGAAAGRGGRAAVDGGRLRGGAPADAERRLDGRQRQAELAAGVDGQGEGGPHLRRRRAALRRAVRRARLRRDVAAREVGARREDPRHLRGHPADPAADHRAPAAQEDVGGAAVGDEVALVTGASAGIGEATARRLHRDGYALVLVARRQEKLDALARELGGATVVAADLVTDGRARRVREVVEREHGRLDLLVNNAGGAWRGSFEEGGWENVERHMELNFDAVVRLTEALLPLLRRSAPSQIVNVASTAGRVSRPRSGSYSAAKFALIGWTDALHNEEAPHGVHVGMVLPGFVSTEGFPQKELVEKPRTRWIVSTVDKVADAIMDAGPGGKAERYVPRPYWIVAMLRIVAPSLIRRATRGGGFTPAASEAKR